ncbi:uncharacterized protein MELLADRAFT_115792 [Melampsora larici-populina 98AG31]|uniref:Uncharacterized protein n=1 Tax=Melampsora larici-populina (strain 98AG31 / pathotype 3-4-7) TaxID=747676 RepID=F4REA0_MELLP|nr:uncharacterized protein MELLADRAFT_115792 [Melampsora larici-populina 98AG31]EGG09305.1 hypothetical protein MELLADRAFT_115792 [Melampsora larici-populina 98AG31]
MSYQQRKLTRRSSVSQHRIVPPDLRQYVPLVDRDKTVKRSTKSPNRASGLIYKLRQGAGRFKLCLGVLLTSLLLFSFIRWRNEVMNERHRKIISIAQDHMHDWMGIKQPPGLVSTAVGRRKFLVKDWQLYRSWNEIRQEIENALLLATLLDRELVLPAFIYASACQYEIERCTKVAPMLVQDEAVDIRTLPNIENYPEPDDGLHHLKPRLPTRNARGWVVPLQQVIDVQHLTSISKNVVAFNTYLDLVTANGPEPVRASLGMADGKWSTDYNHKMSYHRISARFLDFTESQKVDRLPLTHSPLFIKHYLTGKNVGLMLEATPEIMAKCEHALITISRLNSNASLAMHPITGVNDVTKEAKIWNDHLLTSQLEIPGGLKNREGILFDSCLATTGFRSVFGFRYHQSSVPAHSNAQGITAIDLPPGGMFWSTPEARDKFTHTTRNGFKLPQAYFDLATKLEIRMREICEGRAWRAAYLSNSTWAPNLTSNSHEKEVDFFTIFKTHLDDSVSTLTNHPKLLKPLYQSYETSKLPPKITDPIYLSTDMDKSIFQTLHKQGQIVTLEDLVTDEDREMFSAFVFTDAIQLVEQLLLVQAAYFWGQASSTSGWVVNQREAIGLDQNLSKIVENRPEHVA